MYYRQEADKKQFLCPLKVIDPHSKFNSCVYPLHSVPTFGIIPNICMYMHMEIVYNSQMCGTTNSTEIRFYTLTCSCADSFSNEMHTRAGLTKFCHCKIHTLGNRAGSGPLHPLILICAIAAIAAIKKYACKEELLLSLPISHKIWL